MGNIHPSAVVSRKSELDQNVTIGPFAVVEAGVRIGAGCRLASHVVVKEGTELGAGTEVGEGAVLGGRPQHLKAGLCVGGLIIGRGNMIRENATIHRALKEDEFTQIGDGNLIMVAAHVGHDCRVGDETIIANNVLLAGHVSVADRAYLSGAVAVHQFCRIGQYAMVGGQAHVNQDVPPFVTVDGQASLIVGLNTIGLRRNGFSAEAIDQLKAAYRLIYRGGLRWEEMLETLRNRFPTGPAAQLPVFLSTGARGFLRERRSPPAATLKVWRRDHEEDQRRRKAG